MTKKQLSELKKFHTEIAKFNFIIFKSKNENLIFQANMKKANESIQKIWKKNIIGWKNNKKDYCDPAILLYFSVANNLDSKDEVEKIIKKNSHYYTKLTKKK